MKITTTGRMNYSFFVFLKNHIGRLVTKSNPENPEGRQASDQMGTQDSCALQVRQLKVISAYQ